MPYTTDTTNWRGWMIAGALGIISICSGSCVGVVTIEALGGVSPTSLDLGNTRLEFSGGRGGIDIFIFDVNQTTNDYTSHAYRAGLLDSNSVGVSHFYAEGPNYGDGHPTLTSKESFDLLSPFWQRK